MKKFLFIVVSLTCALGLGGTPPSYLSSFSGTVLSSMTERGRFTFTAGTASGCTVEPIGTGGMTFSRCNIAGASLNLGGATGSLVGTFNFDKLFIFVVPQSRGDVLERYILNGTYQETLATRTLTVPASVKFRVWQSAPQSVTGFLELKDLDIRATLVNDAG